ncbi:CBS domain-containing protein [Candidatus Woesearchaeota archaeon]|nr:CBS domain-containing protein [Candidatus Woesearchaeota archaeon]
MAKGFYAERILVSQFKRIDAKESVNRAISLFDKDTDVLIVFDRKQYKGILAERILLGRNIQNEKVGPLAIAAPKVGLRTSLIECARLLIENDISQLPVFDKEIIGIIRTEDLLKSLIPLFGKRTAKEFMTPQPIACSSEDSLGKVMTMFREHHVSRIIVNGQKGIEGVVSIHDIMKKAKPNEREGFGFRIGAKMRVVSIPAGEAMNRNVKRVTPDDELSEVVPLMAEKDGSCVVVVDKSNTAIGIITKRNILEKLVNLEKQESGIFIQVSSKVNDLNRNAIYDEINSFISKFSKHLGSGSLYCYITKHKETLHHMSLFFCRIHFHTSVLDTQVHADGWGEEQMIKNTLRRLKTAMLKAKELKKNIAPQEYFEHADFESLS